MEAARARASVIVLDEDKPYDLFELVELGEDLARVRSPFLFEIGEELAVRIERDGRVFDAQARVRAHVGPADARVTELEISLPVSR
ncbi:MAG TPA: hypothetical protein VK427_20600 [Kofleriaceae bacterium]|nr:hypothetical protein [Kofleriaceae bacterium]